tara:strand:+ start:1079 stop:1552 length:474 start_codon:yes stop_codon:yes gene_type:complete
MTYNKRLNKKSIKRRFSKLHKKKSTRRIKRGGSQDTNSYITEFDNFFKKFEDEANKQFPSNSCNSDFKINEINTHIDNFFENQKEKFKRVLENKIKCKNMPKKSGVSRKNSGPQVYLKPNDPSLNNYNNYNSLINPTKSHKKETYTINTYNPEFEFD